MPRYLEMKVPLRRLRVLFHDHHVIRHVCPAGDAEFVIRAALFVGLVLHDISLAVWEGNAGTGRFGHDAHVRVAVVEGPAFPGEKGLFEAVGADEAFGVEEVT